MAELKSPRRRPTPSRRRSVAADPSSFVDESVSSVVEPMAMAQGSVCGHDGCETSCNVRYVGAVSQITDHHIMKAAHAGSHVWAAAVISGLAVVLTGAVAYTSVQAESNQSVAAQQAMYATRDDMSVLLDRITQLQDQLEQTREACHPTAPEDQPGDGTGLNTLPRANKR